jgi:hypothetical protein
MQQKAIDDPAIAATQAPCSRCRAALQLTAAIARSLSNLAADSTVVVVRHSGGPAEVICATQLCARVRGLTTARARLF